MAEGINSSGLIVGTYDNGTGSHAFLYNAGVFTTIDDPSATTGTFARGINRSGQIVGFFGSTGTHGFIDNGGIFSTIDDPNAAGETFVNGINDDGLIVGGIWLVSFMDYHLA